MAMSKMSSMFMVMAVVLLGAASTATASSGIATFYEQYTPSACYGNANMGNMVAAASDSFWNNGAVCGQCYRMRCTGAAYGGSGNPCTGRSVTVKIVDECASSDGCQSTIDLSKQAFALAPASTPARSRSHSTPRTARNRMWELLERACRAQKV